MKDNDSIWVCPDCGSENVLEPTWVYSNGEVMGMFGDRVECVDFDLCNDCNAQMQIISKTEYIEKENNNA